MQRPLIISTSLRDASLSRVMAGQLALDYAALGATPDEIDLREWPLPLCDGEAAYGDAKVGLLAKRIQAAGPIVVATPVYNYDVNAAVKNLIELTGNAWENKIVGFLCAAGGSSSYMAVMAVANSLMLDFRCLIIPRFVYAVNGDFEKGQKCGAELTLRVRQFAEESLKIRRD